MNPTGWKVTTPNVKVEQQVPGADADAAAPETKTAAKREGLVRIRSEAQARRVNSDAASTARDRNPLALPGLHDAGAGPGSAAVDAPGTERKPREKKVRLGGLFGKPKAGTPKASRTKTRTEKKPSAKSDKSKTPSKAGITADPVKKPPNDFRRVLDAYRNEHNTTMSADSCWALYGSLDANELLQDFCTKAENVNVEFWVLGKTVHNLLRPGQDIVAPDYLTEQVAALRELASSESLNLDDEGLTNQLNAALKQSVDSPDAREQLAFVLNEALLNLSKEGPVASLWSIYIREK